MTTHINNKNNPVIVDISNKKQTLRTAKAQGIIKFSNKAFKKIEHFKSNKGEIKNIAIIAGILGAKKTSEIIPLCHNISIEDVNINIRSVKNKNIFIITCNVKSFGKTGVEMEALTGASLACLAVYDMCKSVDKNIVIEEIKLLEKKGGKSNFIRSKIH